MYSAQLGRFLSQDPLTRDPTILSDNNWFGERLSAMQNAYRYADNNPVNWTDPSGLVPNPIPPKKPPVLPTMPVTPLPSNSPQCCKYNPNDTYAGAGAACFCQCGGDSPWSQYVRGCLRDLYEKGVSPSQAHATCYELADNQNFPGGRPWLTLIYCYAKCFGVWAPYPSTPPGATDLPPIPPIYG